MIQLSPEQLKSDLYIDWRILHEAFKDKKSNYWLICLSKTKKLSHNSLSQVGGRLVYESDWVMQSLSCIGVLVSLRVLQHRGPIFLPIKASVRILSKGVST